MADVIKSYLISLSSSVDKASFDKFASTLSGTSKSVASSVGGMAGSLLTFQTIGITAFASVGFGIVAYIDKLGRADLMMRQHAMQHMMTVQQYRAMTMALDTMGVSLEDVFNGTAQMKRYFTELINDETKMNALLGKDFEQKMTDIQDVQHQLDRLELKAKWFGMEAASDLLEKLGFGQGGILLQLEKLNDFVLKNMPRWSDELSTDVIPYFADLWAMLKQLKVIAGELELSFVHMMGAISGDTGLKNSTGSFADFGKSIGVASHEFGVLMTLMLKFETVIPPLFEMLIDMLSGASDLLSGHPWDAGGDFNRARDVKQNELIPAFEGIRTYLANKPFAYNQPESVNEFMKLFRNPEIDNPHTSIYQNMDFQRLVMGVAQIESGGRQTDSNGKTVIGPPIAGTTDRAVGMMQLMPSTAKMLGVDPYNAAQNFVGGEKYLAQLLLKHGGNVHDTLAEYGGFRTQSPDDYIRKVERAGGITIGTIVIQSAPSMTPEQHTKAIKKGVGDALKDYNGLAIMATGGAYGGG